MGLIKAALGAAGGVVHKELALAVGGEVGSLLRLEQQRHRLLIAALADQQQRVRQHWTRFQQAAVNSLLIQLLGLLQITFVVGADGHITLQTCHESHRQ